MGPWIEMSCRFLDGAEHSVVNVDEAVLPSVQHAMSNRHEKVRTQHHHVHLLVVRDWWMLHGESLTEQQQRGEEADGCQLAATVALCSSCLHQCRGVNTIDVGMLFTHNNTC